MLQCGLLGARLGHSYSPQIHGLLGDYAYTLYEKTQEELESFLKEGEWDGLNVTIPYKKQVLPFCDTLSDAAKAIGSVNTLVRRPDGSIFGDNTDAFGFRTLLEANHMDPAGKKVLILGNGGACASVRYILDLLGADSVVISRNGENNYQNLDRHKDAALLVNTTPVGMYPHNGEQPLDLVAFPALEGVLDIIYNPARTALVMQAQELEIPSDTGLLMLVAQALRSSELFTGKDIPLTRIQEITDILSGQMQNLILIGMPGCGKSSVAAALGHKCNKKVVDTDRVFQETYDISPEQCIRQCGEPRFREMETRVLQEVCKQSGQIIATGGGCVTVPQNYRILHQNGKIIWIQRDISLLPVDGRPLSQAGRLEELYEKRKPLYERFADITADNNGTIEETVSYIL